MPLNLEPRFGATKERLMDTNLDEDQQMSWKKIEYKLPMRSECEFNAFTFMMVCSNLVLRQSIVCPKI